MRFILACLWALVVFSAPVAAVDVLRTDAPGWVIETALPEVDPALLRYADGGVYYLLFDDQVRWQGGTRFYYSRISVKVLSRAGLEEAATITRDFDPASETITLTHLDIIRDGQRIALRDKAVFDVFRQESDLDDGIIDGMLTAHTQVPDVRVGDIVDFGILWTSKALFAGQNDTLYFRPEYSMPVGMNRITIDWPKAMPYHLTKSDPSVVRRETDMGDLRRIELSIAAHPPIAVEDDVPPEANSWRRIYFSGVEDWPAIARPFADYYDTIPVLPEAWKDFPDMIRAEHSGAGQQAYAALYLVQDRIRYVGIEVGRGGYFSRTPEAVIKSGFGDCKDKAVLLVALLRALGVEADVAFSDLDKGYGIKDRPPADAAFGHMVVRAVVEGKEVWMDPTDAYQAGWPGSAAAPADGYALPITGKAAGQLLLMPEDPVAVDREAVTQQFTFENDAVLMLVDTLATGRAADRLRTDWAETAASEMEATYLAFYDDAYPGIVSLQPVAIDDNRADNRFIMHEEYEIPSAALHRPDLFKDFPLFLPDFRRFVRRPPDGPRTQPFFLGAPRERLYRIIVSGAPINFEPPKAVSVTDPAFAFSYKGQAGNDGDLELNWRFAITARTVAPDLLAAYGDARAEADDATYWTWDLTPDE